MRTPREQAALVTHLNDKSRKVARVGNHVYVPLKFDAAGNPLTRETFNVAKHVKSLNLYDLQFLKAWREQGWDTEKACKITGVPFEKALKLVRRLQVFKDEEERIKALADIPTTPWITAKHTENVYEGKLDDSQRDSLKELAKITGSYKQVLPAGSTINVFNLPPLGPEQAAKVKEVFDTIALAKDNVAA